MERFILDACTFADGEFEGCSPEVMNSGLNAFFLTIPNSRTGFQEAARSIGSIHYLTDDQDSKLSVAKKYDDLVVAKEKGIVSIILWFQDPHPVENKLELLKAFYLLGLRVCQLTYNKSNYIGTGCTESVDSGLTDFGKKVVREMNELGIVIDASHSSKKTALDAIWESTDPVIFSHANVKSLTNNPRNKTDEEIKLVAEKGGVIGLTTWGPLCWKGLKNEQPVLNDYLDHVDYIVDLVGIDFVGFGSDKTLDNKPDLGGTHTQSQLYPSVVAEYDKRVGTKPEVRHALGFKGVQEIENVIEGLAGRGYKEKDINKFLGGNFLRVIKQVWKD